MGIENEAERDLSLSDEDADNVAGGAVQVTHRREGRTGKNQTPSHTDPAGVESLDVAKELGPYMDPTP